MQTQYKFVFIGAGSSVFTLRLIGDIMAEPCVERASLALVDIDEAVLKITEEAVRQFVAHTGREFTVSAHTDYRGALEGADYVFFTIATGAYARWKDDIQACTAFGVSQSVGDTIGPGGIIRTLRTIPVLMEIVRDMETVCPDAWLINYTNPEGAMCLAIQKYSRVKSFGLCHGTPDTAKWLAEKVFQVRPERLRYRAAGLNHLTWFTDLAIDGKDVYPLLRDKLQETGMDRAEPISAELLRIYGLYPAPGDRHVGEFFPFFLKEAVLREQDYTWKNNDFIAVDGWREEASRLLNKIRLQGIGFEALLEGSGETATHFMRALATGEIASEMVNVINNGYIDNISDGIIVELPTYIDEFGLHPQKIGRLPEGIAHHCERLGREYLLMVDAAIQRDYSMALQAMYMDPLAANCDHPEALLKNLIQRNLDLLPEEWKRYC